MKKKIVVAGSRSFNNYDLLAQTLYRLYGESNLSGKPSYEIVSGTARGADHLGEIHANTHGLKVHRFPADWDKHGKVAGHLRNEEMAKFGDEVVLFWDGESKGTANMIKNAINYKKPIHIIFFQPTSKEAPVQRQGL